jgi:hypothetical protein
MNEHSIYQEAHYKGNTAVEITTVTPMVVQQRANPLNDDSELIREYYVSDGVCGFASVNVKPANCKFAKFLVANGLGRKAYNGGVSMSVRDFNQSLTKKEAYEAWEQWLEKCPVWFLKLRTPTVDLETVQFDFDQYEDTKEAE